VQEADDRFVQRRAGAERNDADRHRARKERTAKLSGEGWSVTGNVGQRLHWARWFLLAVVFANAISALAQAEVHYSLSLAGYRDHILRVRVEIPAGTSTQTLQLPVWNALYQIRDFAQYIGWMRARDMDGVGLPVRELDKSSWRIENTGRGAVVEYELFADNPGPYGAQVDSRHAFLNLAEVLAYPVASRALPMQVRFVDVPKDWGLATVLMQSANGYEAANYDRLVDSPVELGSFREADFDEGGGHYRVVVDADASDYDINRIGSDLRKIVAAATSWMNDRPYSTYMFLYHFQHSPGGGGMEHAYCTAIDLNAEVLSDAPNTLLDVSAHEFFHLWNVKRIRPQSLEPIDYTKENYTTALWFSEGVTSTVEDIILLRGGLMNESSYLQRLGAQITELERRTARSFQSAEDSSLNAWLEKYSYYRQPQRSISYYNKGQLLGVLLDLSVRENSQGSASLREVFQWLNQHYAQQGKFFPDSAGVREAAAAVGGGNLQMFFDKYVAGTDEIPWDDFFRTVGLRVVRKTVAGPDLGFEAARNFDQSPSVLSVEGGSDAAKAGLAPGDTILEVNGHTAASDFESRMASLRPGDLLKLRVHNRRGDRELQWKIGSREDSVWEVQDLDQVTEAQRARRAAWLKGEAQTASRVSQGAVQSGTEARP
jgi:predicted metalloprotease with PDZ domain